MNFTYHGRRYRKSTKTSDKKLARLILSDIELKIVRDSFGFGELEAKKVRLAEFFDKYLEFSQATKAKNSYLLDRHSGSLFLRFTGNVLVSSIKTKTVEDFKIARLKAVKPISVNLELRHLKSMFQTGVEWEELDQNPLAKVKQIRIKNSNFPKYFTKAQVRQMLVVIPEGKFKTLIQFYLPTGCRRGEAIALNWDDIDFKVQRITIRESKSGESRVIPMNSKLRVILLNVERNGNFVFGYSKWHVSNKFKKYLNSIEMKDVRHLSIHSLRHTFASHLVMNGVVICIRLLNYSVTVLSLSQRSMGAWRQTICKHTSKDWLTDGAILALLIMVIGNNKVTVSR